MGYLYQCKIREPMFSILKVFASRGLHDFERYQTLRAIDSSIGI